jgi:heterodisulfide reductase subunit B
MQIEEIQDWNCCGATIASGVVGDYTQQVISARNLALAEAKGNDILLGCTSCYLSLATTNKRFQEDERFARMANEALAAGGLKYNGTIRVRQFLEALSSDIGLETLTYWLIAERPMATAPLRSIAALSTRVTFTPYLLAQ